MEHKYTPPVSELLTYGECKSFENWPDYLSLGFTEAHIPELIRMAEDEELLWAMSDTLEVWAPVHAWRTLGQLRAEEAIPTLVKLFALADEDDDWVGDEIPLAFAMIGPKVLPAVEAYICNSQNSIPAKIDACNTFLRLHQEHFEKEAVAGLTRCLEKYSDNDPEFNAILISHAIDMGATEVLPVIQKAFEAERVDFMVCGDFEDVEIEMGVRKKRSTPPLQLVRKPELNEIHELLNTLEKSDVTTPPAKKKKIGRNDPCPCGSGKKYKKCCLGKKK